MAMHSRRSVHSALLIAATTIAFVSVSAQQPPARGPVQATKPDTLVAQVRAALGHGNLAEARRLATAASGPKTSVDFATALVDLYEGKDGHARELLTPIAQANPLGDAAV